MYRPHIHKHLIQDQFSLELGCQNYAIQSDTWKFADQVCADRGCFGPVVARQEKPCRIHNSFLCPPDTANAPHNFACETGRWLRNRSVISEPEQLRGNLLKEGKACGPMIGASQFGFPKKLLVPPKNC
eukprot:1144417-Pelagomonas_calceolata.AAC.3